MRVVQSTLGQGFIMAAVLIAAGMDFNPLSSQAFAAAPAQVYERRHRSSPDELITVLAAAIRLARQHFLVADGFEARHLTQLSWKLRCGVAIRCAFARGGWRSSPQAVPGSPRALAQLLYQHSSSLRVQGEGVDQLEHVNAVFQAIDKYSEVVAPEQWQELQDASAGSWFGVGIRVRIRSADYPVIDYVEPGSPAADVGLGSGDIILAIGGQATYLYDYEQFSAALAKEASPHAEISLTVQHAARGVRREYVLPRDKYILSSVATQLLSEDFEPLAADDQAIALADGWAAGPGEFHSVMAPSYLWLKFFEFSHQTPQEFVQALGQLRTSSPYRGVVVDLRDNGGGVLASAVMVADYLLNQGKVVTVAVPRQDAGSAGWISGPDQEHDTRSYWADPHTLIPPHIPMVVLVNSATASAAELLVSSLRIHRGAMIVGEPTAGKTSIQVRMALPHGYGLKITSSQFWVPDRSHHPGAAAMSITPDLWVTWPTDTLDQIAELARRGQPICGEHVEQAGLCDKKLSLSRYAPAMGADHNPWILHHQPKHEEDARWAGSGASSAPSPDSSDMTGQQLGGKHLRALFLAYQAWRDQSSTGLTDEGVPGRLDKNSGGL